jgi:hypothetical protein
MVPVFIIDHDEWRCLKGIDVAAEIILNLGIIGSEDTSEIEITTIEKDPGLLIILVRLN